MKVTSIVPWTRRATLAGRDRPIFPSLFDEADRYFEEIRRGVPSAPRGSFAPHLDVRDADDAIVVTADLPGLVAEDFEVEIADDVLTIRGERRAEDTSEAEGRRWTERSHGRFERSILLPERAISDDATAKYNKGVLTIRVPKAPDPATQTRKITVTTS